MNPTMHGKSPERVITRRAPFQVLVLPFRRRGKRVEYAIFRRKQKTGGYWQFIAGGAELGERATQAARREACESNRNALWELDLRLGRGQA